LFHPRREPAGRRTEFKDAPTSKLDPTQVFRLTPEEIPHTIDGLAVAKTNAVVKVTVLELNVLPPRGEALLELRLKLAEIVGRRLLWPDRERIRSLREARHSDEFLVLLRTVNGGC
jgi:hypothetical protein